MKSGAMQHVQKALHPEAMPPLDKAQAMAIINQLAQESVDEQDVYISRARLANDLVDRSGERFPVAYLERFAQTLPGKPLLLGHDKSSVPAGRWFSASVARDTDGTHHLIADFYLEAKGEAARLLKLGIAKDVSIGFIAGGRTCDLDGTTFGRDHVCEKGHRLNQEYEGKRCTATYNGDMARVEALEGSLVGVGCQIGAQAMAAKALGAGVVLESWNTEDAMDVKELEARIKVLEDENRELTTKSAEAKALESLAEEGKAYRADLMTEIDRKLGVLERNADLDKSLLANAPVATLKAYDERLGQELNAKFPPSPQSKMLGNGAGLLPELRPDAPPPPSGSPPPPGMRTSPFHMWDEE